MNAKLTNIAAIFALAGLLFSCSGDPHFKVEGEVEGADNVSLVLEKSDFQGFWVPVDSTRTSASGSFSIKAPSPVSPEIYRLSMGDRFIYFPVDSIETVSLTTSSKNFGSEFSLSGSENATRLAAFEKDLLALNATDSAALAQFKRNVYSKYIKDAKGSIVSYYVLTKIVGDKPLYDPADRQDAKYYAAVATQFDQFRPDDPHGRMVKQVSLQVMKARNKAEGKRTVVEAPEVKVLDIELPDETGKNVKLSDVVGKGKKVAVIFSMMTDEKSHIFNRELARIYNDKAGTVQFYQVSFDPGQYEWREAAKNLPWITVLDPAGNASTAITDYNLYALPAVFIYSAEGELIDRAESIEDLRKKL